MNGTATADSTRSAMEAVSRLVSAGRLREAEQVVRQAIAAFGERGDLYSALGICCERAGNLDGAVSAYSKAVALSPFAAPAHFNLGNAFRLLHRWRDAEASYRKVLALEPDNLSALKNLAATLLTEGDFVRGWPLWSEMRAAKASPMGAPTWKGEPINGKHIVLHERQGPGDTTQFVRYLPHVHALGARITLEAPQTLHRLLGANFPYVEFLVKPAADRISADYTASLMDLPWRLDLAAPALCRPPYLTASPPAALLGKGPKIGVAWASNSGIQPHKSCPFAEFSRLLSVKGGTFFSLTVGAAGNVHHRRLHDLRPELVDFAATAAHVAAMDVIISVDTAVAHLAGAMGKKTIVLLPFSADWRWNTGSRSLWYDNMELVRQPRPGDWSSSLEKAGSILGRIVRGAGSQTGKF